MVLTREEVQRRKIEQLAQLRAALQAGLDPRAAHLSSPENRVARTSRFDNDSSTTTSRTSSPAQYIVYSPAVAVHPDYSPLTPPTIPLPPLPPGSPFAEQEQGRVVDAYSFPRPPSTRRGLGITYSRPVSSLVHTPVLSRPVSIQRQDSPIDSEYDASILSLYAYSEDAPQRSQTPIRRREHRQAQSQPVNQHSDDIADEHHHEEGIAGSACLGCAEEAKRKRRRSARSMGRQADMLAKPRPRARQTTVRPEPSSIGVRTRIYWEDDASSSDEEAFDLSMDNTPLCPSSPSTSTYAASSVTSSFGFRRRESTVTEISQASSVYEESPDLPRPPIPKKPPEVQSRSRIASLAVPPPSKSSITFLEPRKMSLPVPSTTTMPSRNLNANPQPARRSSVATFVPRPNAAHSALRDKPLPTDPPFPISRLRNFRSAPSLRKDGAEAAVQPSAAGARRGSLLPQGFTSKLARLKRS